MLSSIIPRQFGRMAQYAPLDMVIFTNHLSLRDKLRALFQGARAAAVTLAGGRDGAAYFENPNGDSTQPPAAVMQLEEERLIVPTRAVAIPTTATMTSPGGAGGGTKSQETAGPYTKSFSAALL